MGENKAPKKLNTKHQLMMMDLVGGMSAKECCAKHEMSLSRLSVLRRSPLWLKEQDKIKEELLGRHRDRLDEMIAPAMDALDEVLGQGYSFEQDDTMRHVINPPATRVQAAAQVLDRVKGMGKDQEHQGGNNVQIQLYVPGYGTESGKGEVQTIEVEVKK